MEKSKVAEESSSSAEEQQVQKKETREKSAVEKQLDVVYENVGAVQQITGKLTMLDCKQLNRGYELLGEFLADESEDKVASKKHFDAFGDVANCCAAANSTGKFHLRGSEMMLDALTAINDELEKYKDKTEKMQELATKNKKIQ